MELFMYSGALGAFERDADGAFPRGGHAFPGVAPPTLAVGVAGKHRAVDARQVAFVQPSAGNRHDFVAIIEHEGIAVRVTAEIKGLDGAARAGVERLEETCEC